MTEEVIGLGSNTGPSFIVTTGLVPVVHAAAYGRLVINRNCPSNDL